jgi:hypothetical protein
MAFGRKRHRGSIKAGRLMGLAAAILVAWSTVAAADDAAIDEYKVKAAYLYNLTKFVTWPDSSFSDRTSFVITVLGADPFGPTIDQLLADRTAVGRNIRLEHEDTVQHLHRCQILFISRSLQPEVETILAQVAGRPVLTVSDMAGFEDKGGIFTFYLEGPNVRFDINQNAAHKAGLQVSAKLLSLAKTRHR